jgi:hypothetical protein
MMTVESVKTDAVRMQASVKTDAVRMQASVKTDAVRMQASVCASFRLAEVVLADVVLLRSSCNGD